MVWKERGKYGVKTGRTVRHPFSHFRGHEPEVLLKFTRGTENMSDNEMQQFLEENDIEDGLGDFTLSSTQKSENDGCYLNSQMKLVDKTQLMLRLGPVLLLYVDGCDKRSTQIASLSTKSEKTKCILLKNANTLVCKI